MKIGKFIALSAAAIGLGIFLGSVPVADGMTTADLLEEWITGGGRNGVQKSRRIVAKSAHPKPSGAKASPASPGATPMRQADAEQVPAAARADLPQAPITAEAANSPEQTTASDKAALDSLISKKSK